MGGNLRGRGVVKAEFGTCSAQTTPFLSGGVNGYIEEVARFDHFLRGSDNFLIFPYRRSEFFLNVADAMGSDGELKVDTNVP